MMKMPNRTRRGFLQASAATAGASLWGSTAVAKARASTADRIRIGVAGVRGRGGGLIRSCQKLKHVDVAALCDVYDKVLNARAGECESVSGKRPATYIDYRKMLEDDSLDAVIIATPDHWHALQTIWACQAGKDVYVEKVGAHNVSESRMMVDAARHHGRVVQHGTQARSSANVREAVQKLQSGVIGKIYMARAIAFKYRAGGKHEFNPVPKGLDWNLWQGPAQERSFDGLAFSPRWRFVKEFGNGQIGAQGVHQLDMIRWALKLDRHPTLIQAMGGMYSRPTSNETHPSELNVSYRFEEPDIMVTFETRTGYANPEAGMGTTYPWINHRDIVGAIFLGADGYMIIPDFSNYYTFLGRRHEQGPSSDDAPPSIMNKGHLENWIDAVRARDPKRLSAGIYEGHMSSSLCFLGNIAHEAERTLRFDTKAERFIGDEDANRLLTRDYRKPFTLPDSL